MRTLAILAVALLSSSSAFADFQATQIAVGGNFACALDSNKFPVCWGAEDTPPMDDYFGIRANAPSTVAAKSISAGSISACIIADSDGALHCWGGDTYNQVSGAPSGSFDAVTVGDDHACALAGTSVTCWGDNGSGEAVPPSPYSATAVVAAYGASFAITSGTPDYWGYPLFWYGWPTYTAQVDMDASERHACSVDSSGKITCWGTTQYNASTVPPNNTVVDKFSVGPLITCILVNGKADCYSPRWQFGLDTPPSFGNWDEIEVNYNNGCVFDATNHSVACWGSDQYGTVRSVPPLVP